MAKKLYFMTPFLSVVAAHLEKADPPYKDQKTAMYKVRLDIDPADLPAYYESVRKAAGNPTFKIHQPKIGVSIAKKDGKVTLCPSSQFKPVIFDCANNKLEAPRIGTGTILRAYCQLNVHDEGIGLQLIQVQVKKLVEYGGGANAGSAFGAEDGYVAEGSTFGGGEESAGSTTEQDVDALGI